MALMGFGPIIYPPMITYLLSVYGVMGCVLLLGGLSFNIVAVAILLQPIKYHYIREPPDQLETGELYNAVPTECTNKRQNSESEPDSSIENEDDYLESMDKLNAFDKPLQATGTKEYAIKQLDDKSNFQLLENGKL